MLYLIDTFKYVGYSNALSYSKLSNALNFEISLPERQF